MTDLTPAPDTLGLASPQLGAWFQVAPNNNGDIADLAIPGADLSCPVELPTGAIWNAPANGLLSFFVATAPRPRALSTLRQANGSAAFSDDAFVFLFTLLPEVAARLGTLVQAVPRPDSTTAAVAFEATRPVINRLALELSPGTVNTINDLQKILPDNNPSNNDPPDLKNIYTGLGSDAEKARFLGLDFSGEFSNRDKPVTILRRPEKDDQRLLENQLNDPLEAKLWAFDIHGRAYDVGALAAMWSHLAGTLWDNLWATEDSGRQRTKFFTDAHIVHLMNAHEGPLEAAVKARISGQLTDLNAIGVSDVLFTAGTNPAIAFSAAPNTGTDTVPFPRLAPLPAGPYATPGAATPFAGWSATNALKRDYLRVAITDIENLTVGLPRTTGTAQADPRRRISPARNTADSVFLPTLDAVAHAVMDCFEETNATVQFIAPELDRLWGPQNIADLGGGDPYHEGWDDPTFSAHCLKGSGTVTAGIEEDQSVVVHFKFDAALSPDGAWVRLWPHGRDTDTGRRYRMTGGGGRVDGSGVALIVLPLPNGKRDDEGDTPFSFDMLLVTDEGSRLYTDLRASRPAVDDSVTMLAITVVPSGQMIFCPQTGGTVNAGSHEVPAGGVLIAVNGAMSDYDFTAMDGDSLRAEDMISSVISTATADDRLITHLPAFVQTEPGDLPDAAEPGGVERVHNSDFHKASKGQEMYDLAAYDTSNNRGVIGALAARDNWHEAPPAALAHAGVSAAPEIHGEGVVLGGPAADALRLLMRERAPGGVGEFITTMGTPFTAAPAVTDAGPWTAILETAAKGTHGHLLMKAIPTAFNPGKAWDNADPTNLGIKQEIDKVLSSLPGSLSTDGLIDSANFEDSTAAIAFDRVLDKYRHGVQGFARAALAAIQRAEDLVWLQTPSLDNESFAHGAGDIHFLGTLTARLVANPALRCLIIVPEEHLPNRNRKLNTVRKSAIGAALQALKAAAPDRVAWVAPIAGPGRPYHMASTTLIVDDVVMFTGAAHAWRRGLVFDSALSTAVFDEVLDAGRPRTVIAARQVLAGNLLSIDPQLVPVTAPDIITAAEALNTGGGFGRVDALAHKLAPDDSISVGERAVWNPADWTAMLAGLVGDIKTEFENGTR